MMLGTPVQEGISHTPLSHDLGTCTSQPPLCPQLLPSLRSQNFRKGQKWHILFFSTCWQFQSLPIQVEINTELFYLEKINIRTPFIILDLTNIHIQGFVCCLGFSILSSYPNLNTSFLYQSYTYMLHFISYIDKSKKRNPKIADNNSNIKHIPM